MEKATRGWDSRVGGGEETAAFRVTRSGQGMCHNDDHLMFYKLGELVDREG